MLKITDRDWKEFKIGELFNILGSKTTPLKELKKIGKGKYPYITTQTVNNGHYGYFNHYTEQGKVLTIDSACLGFTSYQQNNFTASDHVEKCIPKFTINKYIANFICQIINKNNFIKYSYGYKAAQSRLKKQIILLPVNSSNQPDYDFMEAYMKEKEEILLVKYLKYAETLTCGGGGDFASK